MEPGEEIRLKHKFRTVQNPCDGRRDPHSDNALGMTSVCRFNVKLDQTRIDEEDASRRIAKVLIDQFRNMGELRIIEELW